MNFKSIAKWLFGVSILILILIFLVGMINYLCIFFEKPLVIENPVDITSQLLTFAFIFVILGVTAFLAGSRKRKNRDKEKSG